MAILPHSLEDLPTRQLTPADSNARAVADLFVWQAYDGEWYVEASATDGTAIPTREEG